MQHRMIRALEMADRMADCHGQLLQASETTSEMNVRYRNYVRTGYDWVADRKSQVSEHFFQTYLAMGGGTSRGLTGEQRPRILEAWETETDSRIIDHL